MIYAVGLYFDEETRLRITCLMQQIVGSGVNDYMLSHSIPPHITLTMFNGGECEDYVGQVAEFAKRLSCGDVNFGAIGVFNPGVIYLAPVATEYLIRTNRDITHMLQPSVESLEAYYLPDHWVPHAALAVQMDAAQLLTAFRIVQSQFVPFSGRITRLVFAMCNPYRELMVYPLLG